MGAHDVPSKIHKKKKVLVKQEEGRIKEIAQAFVQ